MISKLKILKKINWNKRLFLFLIQLSKVAILIFWINSAGNNSRVQFFVLKYHSGHLQLLNFHSFNLVYNKPVMHSQHHFFWTHFPVLFCRNGLSLLVHISFQIRKKWVRFRQNISVTIFVVWMFDWVPI